MSQSDLDKLREQAQAVGEPGVIPKQCIYPAHCSEEPKPVPPVDVAGNPPCTIEEYAAKIGISHQHARFLFEKGGAACLQTILDSKPKTKVFIFEEDQCVRFCMIGPADFPLWKFWQEWWEKNIVPSAGTSPYKEWQLKHSRTEVEKQLRLELEARRATVQGLRKQFSMEWYGVDDKDWSEIIAKILEIEHGFEFIDFDNTSLYPEAEW